MSFGFAVGDFLAVGDLAWTLYHDCYKVARGAPQEFQLLLGEISALSNAFKILQEEIKDPKSALVQAGEIRVRMVNEMVKGIEVTLKKLRKIAKKYEILGVNSKRRQLWTKFKWSVDFSDIDALRNKLVYHNSVMSLLLTSVGNSSLERIVSSNAELQSDVKVIRSYISGNIGFQIAKIPSLTAVDDEVFQTTLSAALLKNAEVSQPWSTIGVDIWIEAGRWWLLRSQMELYTLTTPQEKIPLAAYANLMKSSWILIDIIANHPQVQSITASTHLDVRTLSAELKNEFSRLSKLGLVTPDLDELQEQDLRIWEVTKTPFLRPHKDARNANAWKVASGEHVLFQRFAVCKMRSPHGRLPCIILFLVGGDLKGARVVAQSQDGSIILTATCKAHLLGTMKELGSSVIVDEVELIFGTTQDAQTLACTFEATNWYLHQRTATGVDVDDLKAFVILTAVKNLRDDVVARLVQRTTYKEDQLSEDFPRSVPLVALSLASLQMKHDLNQRILGSLKGNLPWDDDEKYEDNHLRRTGMSLLTWATQCGHQSLVEILSTQMSVEHNMDAHAEGSDKMTPLSLASYCGYEGVAQTLVANGADLHKSGECGKTALCYASLQGHVETVRTLLRHGAKIESSDQLQRTSLHLAAQHGHENVMKVLIENNAIIQSESKCTPLLVAAECGQENAMQILIDNGANIQSRDVSGRTLLHLAAANGHKNLIKNLIDNGAYIEAQDDNGTTPIIHAASEGHEVAALLLFEKGAMLFGTGRHIRDYEVARFHGNGGAAYRTFIDLQATVYKIARQSMHTYRPYPPLTGTKRAVIILKYTTSFHLWLCSYNAHIELPLGDSPEVTEDDKGLWHWYRDVEDMAEHTFEFSVVHQEDSLEFGIESSWFPGKTGSVRLQVVNGGTRSVSCDEPFIRRLWKWVGVELDPNAEFVDAVVPGHKETSTTSPTSEEVS